MPTATQITLRLVGVVFGVIGIVVAFIALAGKNGIAIGDRAIGFWVGMAGFLLIIAGCMVPLRPAERTIAGGPVDQPGTTTSSSPSVARYGAQPFGAPASTAPVWGTSTPVPPPPAPMVPAPPTAPAVPAGWHPDPTGRNEQRWWDGQTWTAHALRGGTQVNDPV